MIPDDVEVSLLPPIPDEPSPDVTLGEFFDPAFMGEHTRFGSFEEFCRQSPWAIETGDDIDRVARAALDRYVRRVTAFDSWLAMRNRAAEREVRDRLLV